jgi:ribonuclease J
MGTQPFMKDGEIWFAPMGGVGEFGANLALYGYAGKWLMLDCGVAFADETLPGVDLLTPDPAFIADQRRNLVALVLTHAHEDHLGAVAFLWPQLECPVYATAFTAAILRRKLKDQGLAGRVPLHVVGLGGSLDLDPFRITYVSVAHSILEAHSVAIGTPAGTIVHSGDWKLDDDPGIGPRTDDDALRALGEEGVVALMGDSTNALTEGLSGSEGALKQSLGSLIAGAPGRVAVTQFASNAARIQTVAEAAREQGREVVIVGRSLWRTIAAAQECGYLKGLPALLEEEEAMHLPARNTLLLLTGCQGEPRGAMGRIAGGEHKHVRLGPGDTAIFSSKAIPGNEAAIFRVIGQLQRSGVEVITGRSHFVHVSGHPAREEMKQMIRWLRPRTVVPVHGEVGHLRAHAALAAVEGAETLVVENGALVRLAPGPAEVIGEVPVGKRAVTRSGLVPLDSPGVQDRRRMMFNGSVVALLVMNEDGRLSTPARIVFRGVDLPEGEAAAITKAVTDRVEDIPRARCGDNKEVELAVRQALRGHLKRLTAQRPSIDVEIVRVNATPARVVEAARRR